MYLDFFQITLVIFAFLVLLVWGTMAEYQLRFWRRQAIDCATDYDFLANEQVIRHANSLLDVPKRAAKRKAEAKRVDASEGTDRLRGIVETAQEAGDRDNQQLQNTILLRQKL